MPHANNNRKLIEMRIDEGEGIPHYLNPHIVPYTKNAPYTMRLTWLQFHSHPNLKSVIRNIRYEESVRIHLISAKCTMNFLFLS
jgi:hypothetical protein